MGLLRILLAVVLPWIVFGAGASVMIAVSDRIQEFDEPTGWFPPSYSDNYPLNRRITGYSAEQAKAYWKDVKEQPATDSDAPSGEETREQLEAERSLLKIDLLFPIFYGGAFLFGLLFVRRYLQPPMGTLPLALPVAITCLADWTENSIQLSQLSRYETKGTVDALAIGIASLATQVKLVAFIACGLLLLILGIRAALTLRN